MKYQWEAKDIQLGREIIFNGNERLIIGYVVGSAHKKRCLIHMTDGAVYRERTVDELVDDLNRGNYEPRYVEVAEQRNDATARPKSKKQKIEDQLRQSDLTAQIAERDDIEYGHHESLPRGEHVARRGPR